MSPRTGRPKAENPKTKQLGVRLDKETLAKLDTLTEYYEETRVAVLRRGIEKLFSELKNKSSRQLRNKEQATTLTPKQEV